MIFDLSKPNLARIPGEGDRRAEAILLRVQGITGQDLLDSVDEPRTDLPGMWSDLRLRSRRFSSVPGRSRGDVPPMCPGSGCLRPYVAMPVHAL